ncbi:MAG: S24 family peptidase [bacterium]
MRAETVPVLGQIPAGPLAEALENREGEVAVPEALLPAARGPYFALRVDGESMICAGVIPGSVAVFRHQPTVKNGQIAAVIWEGEATLKRFYRYPEIIILQPANPAYVPTLIPRSQARGLKIVGRLLLVITDVSGTAR